MSEVDSSVRILLVFARFVFWVDSVTFCVARFAKWLQCDYVS